MKGFLRRLFTGKSSSGPKLVALRQAELTAWLEDKIDRLAAGLKKELSDIRDQLDRTRQAALDDLEALESAKLSNDKLPHKVIQIMEGNRAAFIKKYRDFLGSVRLEHSGYSGLRGFSEGLRKRLEDLHSSTKKSYFVLKEFFAHEARKVAESVKKIESLAGRIDGLLQSSGIGALEQALRKARELGAIEKLDRELGEKIAENQRSAEESAEQIKRIREEIAVLKAGKMYNDYEGLKSRIAELEAEEESQSQRLRAIFTPLEPGLKRFERVSLSPGLVHGYLKDPRMALIDDTGLEILETVGKLKKAVAERSIDIRDKKRDKLLVCLEAFPGSEVKEISGSVRQTAMLKREAMQKARRSSVTNDLKELEYRISHALEKQKHVGREAEALRQQRQKITREPIINSVCSTAGQALGIKLVIDDKDQKDDKDLVRTEGNSGTSVPGGSIAGSTEKQDA